ncbi:MAG: metallophosphoesterase [Candidatus Gastranaerophilaceae bacterium]
MAKARKKQSKKGFSLKKRWIFAAVLIAILWCFIIEPNILVVKKYKIQDKDLRGVKVVLAGDFHVKPYQAKRLKYTVDKINAQNPDVVFLIGDYVNMHSDLMSYPISKTAKALSDIRAKHGVYTVLGNHDYFKDGKTIKRELNKNGITVLENRNKKVRIDGKLIYVAGIEDITTAFPNVKKALHNAGEPLILLSHQPDIFPEIPKDGVNLTLAGHTHGGQVVIPFIGPIIVPSKYGKKYASGYFEEDGKKMIVTKGIGTSILPVRFNCVPEIDVIEFE